MGLGGGVSVRGAGFVSVVGGGFSTVVGAGVLSVGPGVSTLECSLFVGFGGSFVAVVASACLLSSFLVNQRIHSRALFPWDVPSSIACSKCVRAV